ncbi:DUF5123 domain-containing protein [Niabella beijingensis]|uniref:DUF5123 domain-containing protein n=1 Tax=Niabella beijingensis TaxID=2872700 RepID=UPI001CBA7A5B|nr:DUF5123 domain-containing protein [Niabella beijingensis]MBZ4188679.1 DUF5123 domain-containing protein [Niabella beijingensis]
MKKQYQLLFLCLALSAYTLNAQVLFVDAAATGANNGTSWTNAYQSLSLALQTAQTNPSVTEIWVAKGTYSPASTNNRDSSFYINRNNLRLYGGFAGNETSPDQRNIAANTTTLDGRNIAYHTMIIELDTSLANPPAIDNTTLIDGFTFINGNANKGGVTGNYHPQYAGGALFISCSGVSQNITPVLQNCTFKNNYAFQGGGAVAYYGISTASNTFRVFNCIFQENRASYAGGGLSIMQLDAAYYGVPGVYNTAVSHCSFNGNIVDNASQSQGATGGGIDVLGDGQLRVTGTVFSNNTITKAGTQAVYKGSAISLRTGNSKPAPALTLVNSLVYYSGSENFPVLYNAAGTAHLINSTLFNAQGAVLHMNANTGNTIENSIFWTGAANTDVMTAGSGSPAVTFTNSTYTATYPPAITVTAQNASTSDPLFNNPAAGDFTLQAASPAINTGDNALYNVGIYGNADLAGYNRVANSIIDMGAYEANSAVLPVLFGTITAAVRNNMLLVKWTTQTETNNDHFEIEASADGQHFKKIATVASKAEGGNASSGINYEYQINVAEAVPLLGIVGMSVLCLMFPSGNRRKGWMLTALAAGIVFYGCTKKETAAIEATDAKLYIRIAQVDKDGKKEYSKIIQPASE